MRENWSNWIYNQYKNFLYILFWTGLLLLPIILYPIINMYDFFPLVEFYIFYFALKSNIFWRLLFVGIVIDLIYFYPIGMHALVFVFCKMIMNQLSKNIFWNKLHNSILLQIIFILILIVTIKYCFISVYSGYFANYKIILYKIATTILLLPLAEYFYYKIHSKNEAMELRKRNS